MTKPRGNEPYKLRNSRYKLLVTILYHRALNRPTANTVDTGPSELTRLAGLSKNHITVDNLKWLEDMNYITEVECRYGSVKFKINTHLIVAQEPKPAAPSVGSPSESALAGGVVISHSSEAETIEGDTTWKQEKEAEGQKTASEKSSAASISPPKLKLKLKPPFTTE